MTHDDLVKQLTYVPERHGKVPEHQTLVIGGMGGSALAADALTFLRDTYDARVHRDYGLPRTPEDALYIAISYSGNTEEALDFAQKALERNVPLAVVTSGGRLLQFARMYNLPYVEVPSGMVPRNALMYLVRGLLSLLGDDALLRELARVTPDWQKLEELSEDDAHYYVQGVPLFYTSERNSLIGKLATTILSEAGRTPTFANTFPSMNHGEMQAFDRDMPDGLSHIFRAVLVRDDGDDHRVLKRMHVYEKLMKERERVVRWIDVSSGKRAASLIDIWARLLLSAKHVAETRDIDSDTQPLVDEFKTCL